LASFEEKSVYTNQKALYAA